MRDSQFQTPQKDQVAANRRSKSNPDLSKTHRKSLNPAFAAISEEKVTEFSKETTEFSSPISESAESSVISQVDRVVTSTPETIVSSDQASSLSSRNSIITSDEHEASVAPDSKCESHELDSNKNTHSVEVEMVMKHFTAARIQVLRSEVDDLSKKLLDVLLNVIIEEYQGGLYKERDLIYKLLTSKVCLILLNFTLGVLTVFVFLFLKFGESSQSYRPPPT